MGNCKCESDRIFLSDFESWTNEDGTKSYYMNETELGENDQIFGHSFYINEYDEDVGISIQIHGIETTADALNIVQGIRDEIFRQQDTKDTRENEIKKALNRAQDLLEILELYYELAHKDSFSDESLAFNHISSRITQVEKQISYGFETKDSILRQLQTIIVDAEDMVEIRKVTK